MEREMNIASVYVTLYRNWSKIFQVREPLVHSMLWSSFMWISMPANRKFPVNCSGNPEYQMSVICVYKHALVYSWRFHSRRCFSFLLTLCAKRITIRFIHLVVCLTTGPKPLPNRALHIVRSRASSFKWEYPLLSLTLRRLMSYIYGAPILNVSRSHTTTQHSR